MFPEKKQQTTHQDLRKQINKYERCSQRINRSSNTSMPIFCFKKEHISAIVIINEPILTKETQRNNKFFRSNKSKIKDRPALLFSQVEKQ